MNGVVSDTINTVSTDTHPIAAPTSPPADSTPRIRTVPEHSATATFAPRLTNIVLGVEQGPQCFEEQDKMNGVASERAPPVARRCSWSERGIPVTG